MGARKTYPEFEDMTTDEVTELLRLSKLSSIDKEIAAQCLVWCKCDIEAGVEVGYHRTTVGRRMENIILPELRRILARTQKEKATA